MLATSGAKRLRSEAASPTDGEAASACETQDLDHTSIRQNFQVSSSPQTFVGVQFEEWFDMSCWTI